MKKPLCLVGMQALRCPYSCESEFTFAVKMAITESVPVYQESLEICFQYQQYLIIFHGKRVQICSLDGSELFLNIAFYNDCKYISTDL